MAVGLVDWWFEMAGKKDSLQGVSAKSSKGQMLSVRVSAEEHTALQAAADKAGMSVSGFFRSLVLEGAGVRPVLTADDRLIMAMLLEDMRMIGVNLNQVARAVNKNGEAAGNLSEVLEGIQRTQAAVMSELRMWSERAGRGRRGGA